MGKWSAWSLSAQLSAPTVGTPSPPFWAEWLLHIQEGTVVSFLGLFHREGTRSQGLVPGPSEAVCPGPGPLLVASWEAGKRSPREIKQRAEAVTSEEEIGRHNARARAWRRGLEPSFLPPLSPLPSRGPCGGLPAGWEPHEVFAVPSLSSRIFQWGPRRPGT